MTEGIEGHLREAWRTFCSQENVEITRQNDLETLTTEPKESVREKYRKIVPLLKEAVRKGHRFKSKNLAGVGKDSEVAFDDFDPCYFLLNRILTHMSLCRNRLTHLEFMTRRTKNSTTRSMNRQVELDYEKGTKDENYILSELSYALAQLDWVERKTYGTSFQSFYEQASRI